MDIYIVVDIVLHHHKDLKQWFIARLLCKTTRDIVDRLEYKRDVYGRATFIIANQCGICRKKFREADVGYLWYPTDDITRRRIITHCPHWFCKISAVCSMLEDVRDNNIHVVRKPYLPEDPVLIPRSSGQQTEATLEQDYTVIRDGKHYVKAKWGKPLGAYYKFIALEQLSLGAKVEPPTMDALLTDRCDRGN